MSGTNKNKKLTGGVGMDMYQAERLKKIYDRYEKARSDRSRIQRYMGWEYLERCKKIVIAPDDGVSFIIDDSGMYDEIMEQIKKVLTNKVISIEKEIKQFERTLNTSEMTHLLEKQGYSVSKDYDRSIYANDIRLIKPKYQFETEDEAWMSVRNHCPISINDVKPAHTPKSWRWLRIKDNQ